MSTMMGQTVMSTRMGQTVISTRMGQTVMSTRMGQTICQGCLVMSTRIVMSTMMGQGLPEDGEAGVCFVAAQCMATQAWHRACSFWLMQQRSAGCEGHPDAWFQHMGPCNVKAGRMQCLGRAHAMYGKGSCNICAESC